jgi:hypothetical protein
VKVYIAGPINGYPDGNKEAFEDAAQALIDLGHEPVNPHIVGVLSDPHVCRGAPATNGHKYGCYMIPDLKALLDCEGYTLLYGWEMSKGATVEEQVARICGLEYVEI